MEFIGHAIGNIASHEIGHLLGSWHTDPHSGHHDLMAPGDLVGAFGLAPDGHREPADAIVARFGQDRYDPAEGFTGIEDTRTRIGLRGGPNPNTG